MGKNKLNKSNPNKSWNPIYKKAGSGAAQKAKNKVKTVKMNLKKLKIDNKEAIEALDKKMNSFREALEVKKIHTQSECNKKTMTNKSSVNVEEAVEELSKL